MGISDDMLAERRADEMTLADRLALEFNDDDNAERLLAVHGEDMVFVDGKGWAIWDGGRYSFQSGQLSAMRKASDLRRIVAEEAEFARREAAVDDDDVARFMEACERKRPPVYFREPEDARQAMRAEIAANLRKHATKCGNLDKQKKALEAAEWRRAATIDDMDRDAWSLVVPGGQIDLRRAAKYDPAAFSNARDDLAERRTWFKPVDRGNLPSRCASAPYDPAATCPKWEDFLALILPDKETRDCVQRILGATLLGENRAQMCVILRGPGGNGKSTLLNGLQAVLGNRGGYAAPCKIEMFLETGHASSGGPTPEEIDLPGARAYIATEPGARDVLSAKKIKSLTGGDQRMSRGLNKDFFFWTPRGVPILSCNRTPKIKDEDEGTRRRLVFVPFDVNLRALPADKQRPQGEIERELEEERSGILNWLLDGFASFIARGLDMPEGMQTLKDNLLASADPVGVFLDEMTTRDPGGRINVTAFYNVLERWAETEGHTLYQAATVRSIMVEKGVDKAKSNGLSVWRGITWAEDARTIVEDVLGKGSMPPPPREAPSDAPEPNPYADPADFQ